MKKWFLVLLLVFAVVVGMYLFLNPAKISGPLATMQSSGISHAAQNGAANVPDGMATGTSSIPAAAAPAELSGRAGQAAPPAPTVENIPPDIFLENVGRAISQYGAQFGGNPVGTNPEITAALNGGNPKQVNFINPQAGMRINGNGELVDPWGTPLFFHQISGTETEVRSAGPDKKMWTADDLVIR